MKRVLIALALIAGCGPSDPSAHDMAPANGSQGGGNQGEVVATGRAGLTGLYEGGAAAQPSQLCMIDGSVGGAQFGLVVWGANTHNCSGSGEAVREGKNLRLTMAGDQVCVIVARIEDDVITLPETAPEGCSYYCGARARLAGASLAKKGSTIADAMKARDLVGEPLCGGLAPTP